MWRTEFSIPHNICMMMLCVVFSLLWRIITKFWLWVWSDVFNLFVLDLGWQPFVSSCTLQSVTPFPDDWCIPQAHRLLCKMSVYAPWFRKCFWSQSWRQFSVLHGFLLYSFICHRDCLWCKVGIGFESSVKCVGTASKTESRPWMLTELQQCQDSVWEIIMSQTGGALQG
jgi:hypothetical protein